MPSPTLGHLTDNCQANACAFVLIAELLKHPKEALLGMFGNTNAIVLDPNSRTARRGLSSGAKLRSGAGSKKLDGVAEEIGKALGQKRLVAEHNRKLALGPNVYPFRVEVGICVEETAQEFREVRRL